MADLPFVSLDMFRTLVDNIAILAMLILIYNFIPDRYRERSRSGFSLAVGLIFSVAAAAGILLLRGETEGPVVGVNIILVPLAGFIGGPVSAIVVAGTLVAGSLVLMADISPVDMVTIFGGILLGVLFHYGSSWNRFPKSYHLRLLLLGLALVALQVFSSSFAIPAAGPVAPGPAVPAGPPEGTPSGALPANLPADHPPGLSGVIPSALSGAPPFVSLLPLFLVSLGGTLVLGSLIGFIDRKKQTEKELVAYKEHLEGLVAERTADLTLANSLQKATIESTADGIVVVDLQGLIRAYNHNAAAIMGLPFPVPKGTPDAGSFIDRAAVLVPDPDRYRQLLAQMSASAEQVFAPAITVAGGRTFEVSIRPQRIGDRIVGRVWTFHDMTDQKNAEDALKAINNKLVLLSNITRHDILNQLTALAVYLELAEETADNSPAAGYLGSMKENLETIRLQVEFTRDYQDLGLREPEWQGVQAAFMEAASHSLGQNVSFRCETGTIAVYADPMIGRVFYNLIDNSIRHGEHVTGIRLSSHHENADLLLVYADDGVGVVPEEKERIFEKGFGKHTGLGMFLIREILSITGITIRETGTPGQGVRFVIRVPSGKFRLS